MLSLAPRVQEPDVPKKGPMIHAAGAVIRCHSGDAGGMKVWEYTLTFERKTALLKPPADWYAEPFLGAIEDLPRQNGFQCLFQDVFGLAVPVFVGMGYFTDKIDQFDVEERGSNLK